MSLSIGSSLLVASPDVAEFERLRSRLNESQTQTRYLQSMVNIRDQELDRARKVSSIHLTLSLSQTPFKDVISTKNKKRKQPKLLPHWLELDSKYAISNISNILKTNSGSGKWMSGAHGRVQFFGRFLLDMIKKPTTEFLLVLIWPF